MGFKALFLPVLFLGIAGWLVLDAPAGFAQENPDSLIMGNGWAFSGDVNRGVPVEFVNQDSISGVKFVFTFDDNVFRPMEFDTTGSRIGGLDFYRFVFYDIGSGAYRVEIKAYNCVISPGKGLLGRIIWSVREFSPKGIYPLHLAYGEFLRRGCGQNVEPRLMDGVFKIFSPTPPPLSLSVVEAKPAYVDLIWQPPPPLPGEEEPNVLEYKIYRDTTSTFYGSEEIASGSPSDTCYRDSIHLEEKTYYYAVTALYEEGESDFTEPVTVEIVPPKREMWRWPDPNSYGPFQIVCKIWDDESGLDTSSVGLRYSFDEGQTWENAEIILGPQSRFLGTVPRVPDTTHNVFDYCWQACDHASLPNCDSVCYHFVKADEIPNSFLPIDFQLSQNYPNPFNPSTEIRYALPKDSYVRLEIYNVIGERVITLVNEQQEAGYKKVIWCGRDSRGKEVLSGVYFYRIVAGDFRSTKRMVMLK